MKLIDVNEQNYDEFIASNKIAVVKFSAEWCPTCCAMEPTFMEIADELSGVAAIGEVDCDENEALIDRFGVDSLPETFVYVGGKLKVRKCGGMSKEDLVALILE